MLHIHFKGWFQCRLARDPDPSDEPRGVSGLAFATVDEPDLDRVIRLQQPVSPRNRWPDGSKIPSVPDVGVFVDSVDIDARRIPGHPLLGGAVELLESPKFEGRNGVLFKSGDEPVDPFHIRISSGSANPGLSIQKKDLWDPGRPGLTIDHAPSALLQKRLPKYIQTDSVEVVDATGVPSLEYYVSRRQGVLKECIAACRPGDELKRAGYQQRLQALDFPIDEKLIGHLTLDQKTVESIDSLTEPIQLSRSPTGVTLLKALQSGGIQAIDDGTLTVLMQAPEAGLTAPPPEAVKPVESTWLITTEDNKRFLVRKLIALPGLFKLSVIQELEDWRTLSTRIFLGARFFFQFEMTGPAQVTGEDKLGCSIEVAKPWLVDFWFGGWDNDALSGFMDGALRIPIQGSGKE